MSTPDTLVPFSGAPSQLLHRGPLAPAAAPGLSAQAIKGLESTYPGILTARMRALLRQTCGLPTAELGAIDFTGRWHPAEPLDVFRPCLTLAIDDEGRRWVAETSREAGLPGPVWCVLPDPAVSLYISEDIAGFLTMMREAAEPSVVHRRLRTLDRDARAIWAQRRELARRSYDNCHADRNLRNWMALLPPDAQLYDLRTPSFLRGWPYGAAGPEGRLYRCGVLPVFAVSAAPSPSRWTRHMGLIAARGETALPAAVARTGSLP